MKTNIYKNEAYEVIKETDTMNFITKSSTANQRKKFNIGDIYINGAVCLKCKQFIRSKNSHDFRTCRCGAVTVDGGSWYARRLGDMDKYINVIERFYDEQKA